MLYFGLFLSQFYLYLYRVFGGGKIISQNDVIRQLITPFVLIYHTVYCWGFKLSLKNVIYSELVFLMMPIVQPLSAVLWLGTHQRCQDHVFDLWFGYEKCDAIRNIILQHCYWGRTTWANITWPCSILLPLCLDQFNSSLQIEQLRNSLFSVNYVIKSFYIRF